MALALEIRREIARRRREQEKRNAETVSADRKAASESAYLDSLPLEERQRIQKQRELEIRAEQERRNLAVYAVKAEDVQLENKALVGPPENKAAKPKKRGKKGGAK